jgi:hypothetical protein
LAGGNDSSAVAANLAGPSGFACTGSTPSILTGSCAHAAAYRSLGTVTVLDPENATPSSVPAGYQGLFYVTNVWDSAVSESGRFAQGPKYDRGGQLYYWNGGGYMSVDLNGYKGAGTATNITLPFSSSSPFSLDYPDGLRVQVTQATIVVNHMPQTNVQSAGCTTTCSASVDGSSVVRALITFTVTKGADSSTFGLAADLGGLMASSSFKAASGG